MRNNQQPPSRPAWHALIGSPLWAPRAPVPSAALWQRWDDLHRLFPTWWFIGGAALSAWRMQSGFDALRRLRMSRRVMKAKLLVDQVDDDGLDALIGMARVNCERQGYFARSILLAYITIPFSIGALVAQLQPQLMQTVLIRYAPAWTGGLLGLGVAVAIRLVLDAQARQFLTMLEIFRVERGTRS